jgi:hypothetical protein
MARSVLSKDRARFEVNEPDKVASARFLGLGFSKEAIREV